MEKNEIKKYLYRNKELMAKFSHYISGNLYYTVQLEDGNYEFPISTIDKFVNGFNEEGKEVYGMDLSSDLGTTAFDNEIKASSLNRWISMAIDKEEFIKL